MKDVTKINLSNAEYFIGGWITPDTIKPPTEVWGGQWTVF